MDSHFAIKKVFARGFFKRGESNQGQKLRSHFPRGSLIQSIAGTGNETKSRRGETSMTGEGGPREVRLGGQASKRQRIVHPYSTHLKESLKKLRKDAVNILLGTFCD